mgnify:CR=1 FL=1
MKDLLSLEKLKVVAGAAIVLTAFGLMLPGVMGFAFSLARVGTIIIVAVSASVALALVWQFVSGKKAAKVGSAENGLGENRSEL